jgi:hypothetical protein
MPSAGSIMRRDYHSAIVTYQASSLRLRGGKGDSRHTVVCWIWKPTDAAVLVRLPELIALSLVIEKSSEANMSKLVPKFKVTNAVSDTA